MDKPSEVFNHNGWFIELRPGVSECGIWYNGEKVQGVSKVCIEMDLGSDIPHIKLELSGVKSNGIGFSAHSPVAQLVNPKL